VPIYEIEARRLRLTRLRRGGILAQVLRHGVSRAKALDPIQEQLDPLGNRIVLGQRVQSSVIALVLEALGA
jgi:hypothetical protein